MEEIVNHPNIETIIVLPRNQRYYRYIINDGEVHAKKYKDIREFLIELAPSLIYKIITKLDTFAYFMIDVIDQKLYDLEPDIGAIIEDKKQTFRNLKPNKIVKEMKLEKNKGDLLDKTKPFDVNLDKIARMEK